MFDADEMVETEEARVLSAVHKVLAICDEAGLCAEFSEDSLVLWDPVLDIGKVFFDNQILKEQSNA